MRGEAAGADVEAAASYLEGLAKVTNKGDYTKQQIFHVDKTDFCWKKIPPKTFIAREEKPVPGFKASKGRLSSKILSVLHHLADNSFSLQWMFQLPVIFLIGDLIIQFIHN